MRGILIGLLAVVAFLTSGGCGPAVDTTPAPEAPPSLPPPELPDPLGFGAYATAALDGVVRSDGTFDTSAGPALVGDLDGVSNGLGAREFYSFDISPIPAGSTITEAGFCAQQIGGSGTPYNTHGYLAFEHVDYGSSLDGSDFDVPALAELGGFANNPNPGTAEMSGRCLDVRAAVQANVDASRTLFQVRLRFKNLDSDFDDVSDHAFWVDMERSATGEGVRPYLTVWYRPPAAD